MEEAIPDAPPATATPDIDQPQPQPENQPPPPPPPPPDNSSKPERPPKKKVKKSHPTSPDKDKDKDKDKDRHNHQLVLYNPNPAPLPERGVPSIGAFTVQCAACFKWRLIPTKDKYEEIREKILELPFVCQRARQWRPDVSCDDPEDISQDGSRLWAIDKPQIPLPPPGWERLIHIRGEGCTRFADVYYAAPNGKKLRSLVEVQRFLDEHKEYEAQGVTLSRFSFQIPRPLHDNYVRKKTPNAAASSPASTLTTSTPTPDIPVLPEDVQPISCFPPEEGSVLPVVTTPPPADMVEPASGNQSGTPISSAKRKIVVKPPSRDKNPSQIAASEVTMLDNTEPSQTELPIGTNAD